MLWTVFQRLPFEQRLEKVAEAGYKNVELVGEYKKWSEDDFRRANAKRRELGITFDTTAGLAHGVGDPRAREALLTDLKNELPIMEKLECPSIIIMSGDVVAGMPRQVQHQSCIDGLKRAAELAQGKNVRLLLENIDKVELVNIADAPGRHEPGTGEINYENIFRTLGRLKYDRYAAMEFLPTSDPVGKLRAAREMAIRAGRA